MTENEQENQEHNTTTTTPAVSAADLLSPDAGGTAPLSGDAQRIAELERELQKERVEKGRLRQANEELQRSREEIAKLKAQVAEFSARKPDDILTKEELAGLDEGQLAAIDKLVKTRVGDVSAAQKAESERLREELARRDASMVEAKKMQFNADVERLAPGLVEAVNEHADAWRRWSSDPRRAASVAAAFADYNAGLVADFFSEFAKSEGISADGDGLAVRPRTSFSPSNGNHPVRKGGDTTVYTLEQYGAEMRKASNDYAAGVITAEEYGAIKKKFSTALAEGRVVER